ncbi:MAG: hypothetical protein JWN68_459 [Nocardioides sp.]|jgi:uncharacterized protein YhfF|uniref:hypothetical protein n=1 Tax=Nocardioides sp. TaxID=35761 RepID=UPI00262FB87E|nr:hypothetical protein [Nocardioides sp.]MCW2832506.1 hypothetical protein [Nocardioides sp.]
MNDDVIGNFWELARFHAKLNVAPSYFGPTTLEVVRPPAWSYGETPAEADEFVARIKGDQRLSTSTPASAYDEVGHEEDTALPVPGALSILCNGAGHPVALLETERVEVGADVVEYFRVVYHGEG